MNSGNFLFGVKLYSSRFPVRLSLCQQKTYGNKKLSEESSQTNGIKAVCIFRQVMQTNLASSDCTTPTQCVAIYSIHDIKNTTTITPLH